MKPTHLTLDGFGSYAKASIGLEEVSLAAVVGENGAGKSTLIDAMLVALFGSSAGSLDTFIRRDADGFAVTLTFEHGGSTYSVTRELKRGRNQKASVSIDGRVLADAKARDVDAAIIDALGYDFDSFTIAHWLKQGALGVFAALDAAKRKEWVASVLPMEVWPLLEASAKESLKAVNERIVRYETERDAFGSPDIDALKEELSVAEAETRRLEAIAASAEEDARKATAIAAAAEQRSNLEHSIAAADASIQRLTDTSSSLADTSVSEYHGPTVSEADAELERLLSEFNAYNRARSEYEALILAAKNADDRFAAAASRYEELEGKRGEYAKQESPVCDRCGQTTGEEARAKVIASMDTDIAEAKEYADAQLSAAKAAQALADVHVSLADPTADVAEARNALASAREHERAVSLAAIQKEKAASLLAQIEGEEKQRATYQAMLDALPPIEGYDPDCIDVARRARLEHSAAVGNEAAARMRLEVATTNREKVLALTSQIADLSRQASDLTLLVKAYGKSGVQARLIEAAVASIEDEANAYLSRFGLGLSVELRTQRENKTGGGVREVLDILVSDGEGTLPIERASGGEKTRINFALAVGLSRFLSAGKGGAPIESFIVDEPEYLDQSGLAEFIACLHALADTTPFVLVVSHLEGMVDSLPQRIVVRKGVNGSKVEVAG